MIQTCRLRFTIASNLVNESRLGRTKCVLIIQQAFSVGQLMFPRAVSDVRRCQRCCYTFLSLISFHSRLSSLSHEWEHERYCFCPSPFVLEREYHIIFAFSPLGKLVRIFRAMDNTLYVIVMRLIKSLYTCISNM